MKIFEVLGVVSLNNTEAIQGLNQTGDEAERTHSRLSGVFSGIGNMALGAGKLVAKGMAISAGAVAAFAGVALKSYAEYEQLVGGVETLFGTGGRSLEEYAASVGKTVDEVSGEYEKLMQAQSRVMNDAKKAYKEAGLSANEYMETVTSFSAALIQSMEGDTVAAAEKANTAIIDMSDNANKMGTSMEMIQNAYQGFAKQNYTMLDNLKLGYGGTQEEMQRLLKDASALSGVEYDMSSYADIIDAIHVIQTEMGITGTTAKEASKTISGSTQAMKASWANLVTGLGDENANLETLIDEFIESLLTAADNILPRIEIILGGIAELVNKLIPKIADKLPGLLNSMLPSLIEGATALFTGLVSALPSLLQILIEQVPFILSELGKAFVNAFPVLLSTFKGLLGQLIGYVSKDAAGAFGDAFELIVPFIENIGGLLMELVEGVLPVLVEVFETLIPMFFDLAEAILPVIMEVMEMLVPFIVQLVEEILPVFTEIMGQLMPFFTSIVETVLPIIVNLVGQLLPVIIEIVQAVLPAFQQILGLLLPILQNLIDLLMPIIQNFIDLMMPILNLIAQAIQPLMDSIVNLIGTALAILQPILETLITTIGTVLTPIMEALFPIFEGLIGAISPILDLLTNLMGNLLEPIIPIIEAVASVVGTVLTGAFESLGGIIDSIMGVFGGLIDFVTGVFTGDWEKAWNGIVNIFKGIFNLIPNAIEGIINGAIGLINGIIGGINKVTKWVGIPAIPKIPEVSLPKLEEGGVLEEGQVGLLEGNGAEAVVPLDQNHKWISAVADDMQDHGIGGDSEVKEVLKAILAVLQDLKESGQNLPETLVDAIADGLTFNVNDREFARLVKAVN